jgi:hypothetical protein
MPTILHSALAASENHIPVHYNVVDVTAMNALTGMRTTDFCFVQSEKRTYQYNGLIWVSASWASVKDFGAKGDGGTDDTAAIQACIDSFPSGGGKIVFPVGQYALHGTLLISKDNMTLEGSGANATLLIANTNNSILQITSNRVSVSGFWFGSFAVRSGVYGILAYGTTGTHNDILKVSDCIFQNLNFAMAVTNTDRVSLDTIYDYQNIGGACSGIQFFFQGVIDADVRQLMSIPVTGTFGGGILLDSDCDTINFYGGAFLGSAGNGVVLSNSLGSGHTGPRIVRINDFHSEDNGNAGFYISAGRDVILNGCESAVNAADGFDILGGDGVRLINCTSTQNGHHGIYIGGGVSVSLIGNDVMWNSQDIDNTYSGIYATGVTNCRIEGNRAGNVVYTLTNGQGFGLTLGTTTDYILCVGNDFLNNKTTNLANASTGINNVIANNIS